MCWFYMTANAYAQRTHRRNDQNMEIENVCLKKNWKSDWDKIGSYEILESISTVQIELVIDQSGKV